MRYEDWKGVRFLSCDLMTPSFPSQFILLKKTLEHHFPNLLDFVSVLVPWGEGVARVPRPLTGRGALLATFPRQECAGALGSGQGSQTLMVQRSLSASSTGYIPSPGGGKSYRDNRGV